MNHQVSRDVTDAYLSTPALFDQLLEAQGLVSELILRSAGPSADGRLAQRLRDEVAVDRTPALARNLSQPAHS